ncbi:MAG: hypothetical protein ACTSWL_03780 [Promethearchaeota archaeon]
MQYRIKKNIKIFKGNKIKIIALLLVLFLSITPIEAKAKENTRNPAPNNDFYLHYGMWGAEFVVDNHIISRQELQQEWEKNYTTDYRWQSVAHLFLDFKNISNNLFNCSIEFKILNITKRGSLIYELSKNHFYMQDNIDNDVYEPFFFQYSQEHKDQDILSTFNTTRDVYMKDINATQKPPLRGLDYSYYNYDLNMTCVEVPWPEDSFYAGYINTHIMYDYLNGFLIFGVLPFYSFEEFCRLAIPSFNSTNFSANPELKLAETNLNFTNFNPILEGSLNPKSNLDPIMIIVAGIIFGLPLVIIIARSIKQKQIKKTNKHNKNHSKIRK